ncbi:hypothetical protein KNO34_00535 [Taylorella equigenitalis]|uniref:hypothetical protein n=1 Tax=Taylorella equigenitalis TaxID=29575 RepID=UPI00237C98DE|nr:hypothetical protein [Taylorella equigenitalis]WDU49495.1 hypothetical protein KNO34_00535 [Taylorella equigenitalis]
MKVLSVSNIITAAVSSVIVSSFIYNFRNLYISPMLSLIGIKSVGIVKSMKPTCLYINENPVLKFIVEYNTQQGNTVISYFRADDKFYFPKETNFVYPSVGSKFKLKYFQYIPCYFIIDNS